ncbi:MAG: alpha/beta fold hydrolase [Thermoleophilia bacterium]|nr:alpha/beta fold hydrolase [Thermoleophilia bacterium]MDH3724991.1 alpha/beta fold hydrolase [Thermoleophilia bacterium]
MSPSSLRLANGVSAMLWEVHGRAPAVLVIHGYGSRKENHSDFAEQVAARGMAAMAIDLPGHGETGGRLGPAALDAVLAGIDALGDAGHARIGLRGSSLGGLLALAAAARRPELVAAIVAICPAQPALLARRLEADWPLAIDLEHAARLPGIARGYWHATGDDRVPWAGTLRLAQISPPPVYLRVKMGGGHTTLQHDPEVLRDAADFLAEHLGGDG